jgi:hypothetical protein
MYRAQPRDTLIGLGRRLLVEPTQWRALQERNHIVDPRRIPTGTVLRIPYDWLRLSRETASVAAVSGTVTQAGVVVVRGQSLPQGSVVETGADGSITIDLADGSVITLQKSSSLGLDQMARIDGVDAAHSIRLKLGTGRAETVVKPHRDVGRFEISTPVAVSAVRGTLFRNAYDPDSSHATTETLEGTVGVASSAAAVSVAAGYGTRIDRDQPPLAPVALLAAPDISGVPTVSTGTTWIVTWPPASAASRYRVQVSDDAAFRTLRSDLEAPATTADLSLLPDGEYWLRIRSIDTLGIEGSDASMRIRRHRLPDPPAASAPLDGANLSADAPRFAWADRGPDARYTMQVAADPSFASTLCERSEISPTHADCGSLPPGRYVWRVATVTSAGEQGPWSALHSFKQSPPGPLPDSPRLLKRELRFGWPSAPGRRYRAEIADDPDFRHTLYAETLSAPEWTIAKMSPGVYYLRVQVVDGDGDAGPFGASRRFAVPIPLWVKITVPLALLIIPLL